MRAQLLAELRRCEADLAYCEAQIKQGAPPLYGTVEKWWLWMVGYGDACQERRLILEELNETES